MSTGNTQRATILSVVWWANRGPRRVFYSSQEAKRRFLQHSSETCFHEPGRAAWGRPRLFHVSSWRRRARPRGAATASFPNTSPNSSSRLSELSEIAGCVTTCAARALLKGAGLTPSGNRARMRARPAYLRQAGIVVSGRLAWGTLTDPPYRARVGITTLPTEHCSHGNPGPVPEPRPAGARADASSRRGPTSPGPIETRRHSASGHSPCIDRRPGDTGA